ncbi:MAG: glutamate synthase subunit beta [Polyangiales bacterium]
MHRRDDGADASHAFGAVASLVCQVHTEGETTMTVRGFLETGRKAPPKRPVEARLHDFHEVEAGQDPEVVQQQAGRCMDCGIPFCHKGCPLGNYIPDWNALTQAGHWQAALERLHATNNFPEFTGRTCPAPCEEACVLHLQRAPVTIKGVESALIDRGWQEGWVKPLPPAHESGKSVAIVGSGPAGLACAQQLRRAGHQVELFERADQPGGLLRYGIPDFKLSKLHVDRRIAQMQAEGVRFHCGVDVGVDVEVGALRARFDALCLCIGAQRPRPLAIPGRDLTGVCDAMRYLSAANRSVRTGQPPSISAAGLDVVILGGGDTGADCLGTALRQGARQVHHFHYKPAPPGSTDPLQTWPYWPALLRSSSSHEEGGTRDWSVLAKAFVSDADGQLCGVECVRVTWQREADGRLRLQELPESVFQVPAQRAFIAIGFVGHDAPALTEALHLPQRENGSLWVDAHYQSSWPGVFACGDATRGASLVVWAIWEGRQAAHHIDLHLSGRPHLPTLPNHLPW